MNVYTPRTEGSAQTQVPYGSWLSSAACRHLHRRPYFSLKAFITCSFLRCEGTDYTSLILLNCLINVSAVATGRQECSGESHRWNCSMERQNLFYGQKTLIDISPKKTYRWPVGI